ncbi:MAG: class I SAM-dependent methyltransferase [Candidatus Hodarchaeales archaeon]
MDLAPYFYAIEFTKNVISETMKIVELYNMDHEEGLSAYIEFLTKVTPSLEKIVKGLKNPREAGFISPRLLRDPLSTKIITQKKYSKEEKEAHIVGYLSAILQLGYCRAKGLDVRQFSGTLLHSESQKFQNIGKMKILPALIQIIQQEIDESDSVENFIFNVDKDTFEQSETVVRNETDKITTTSLVKPPTKTHFDISFNLTCEVCNLSLPFPKHCRNLKMSVKDEKHLNCEVCNETIPIPIHHEKEMKISITKKEKILSTRTHTQAQQDQKLDDKKTAVPFTARLMAYYRAQESKRKNPLIVDPFAERLAGDMTTYFNDHRHHSQSDYPIVRSYYVENDLLTPWCNTHVNSQIIILGAGLDTRAYRFTPLQTHTHTIFEIDFFIVNQYKEEILKNEKPLCGLARISADISNLYLLTSQLLKSGFSSEIPTFWVLEGLAYYLEQELVVSLLKKAAEMSPEKSQVFVDICVPAVADLVFGPFTRYFKWGLDKKDVPSFFKTAGWNVSCSFADDLDQGRDVGQRGQIFVHGVRNIYFLTNEDHNSEKIF